MKLEAFTLRQPTFRAHPTHHEAKPRLFLKSPKNCSTGEATANVVFQKDDEARSFAFTSRHTTPSPKEKQQTPSPGGSRSSQKNRRAEPPPTPPRDSPAARPHLRSPRTSRPRGRASRSPGAAAEPRAGRARRSAPEPGGAPKGERGRGRHLGPGNTPRSTAGPRR